MRGIVADLGGTNARFATAVVEPGGRVAIDDPASLRARDFATAEQALHAYLERTPGAGRDFAAIACAGPVRDGAVTLTNLDWTLDAASLASALGVGTVCLLNDLEAVAWAAPMLGDHDLHPLGAQKPAARVREPHRIAVLGSGTGTNCSLYAPDGRGGAAVLAGEGGHIGFAPSSEQEVKIWRRLRERFGRVSIERLASGPGLLNIHTALCEIGGLALSADLSPEDISERAGAGDPTANAAIAAFARILGSVAGDFALTFGAEEVLIAGGLAPKLLTGGAAEGFRIAFEDKGRFAVAMRVIPTAVIVHPHAALLGAARAVATPGAGS